MVLVGISTVVLGVTEGRVPPPPLFTRAGYLAQDCVRVGIFACLVGGAIVNVRRTDWHRRLMLCATMLVIFPGLGRINFQTINSMAIPKAIDVAPTMSLEILLLFGAAMLFDRINRGRVHGAYYWGLAGLAAFPFGTLVLTNFPPFVALANGIAAPH